MAIVINGNVQVGGNVQIGQNTADLTEYYVTNTTDIQLVTEDGTLLTE